jgi:hypothetical protein
MLSGSLKITAFGSSSAALAGPAANVRAPSAAPIAIAASRLLKRVMALPLFSAGASAGLRQVSPDGRS